MDTTTAADGIIIDHSCQRFHIDPPKIKRLAALACHHLGLVDYELSISFVSELEMRELNHNYRDKDRPTDVLSFPQIDWQTPVVLGSQPQPESAGILHAPLLLGDIVICLDEALANATNIGHGLDRETCFLLVHGLLHLCGHDHMEPEEEERMITQQQGLMSLLGACETPPPWVNCAHVKDDAEC